MLLPDHEIKKLLKEGKIGIEPIDNPEEQIQPSCVDLRLGSEFRKFKITEEAFIDSKNPGEYTEKFVSNGRSVVLHPGELLLGMTKEKIKLPADIAGFVDGRSSIGRLGVTTHITSAWIDPGFEGRLVLEIANLGMMPVTIYPDMRIAKILFFRMSSPAERPYNVRKGSKYNRQDSVMESRIHEEK
jgi:dCTP deaminase